MSFLSRLWEPREQRAVTSSAITPPRNSDQPAITAGAGVGDLRALQLIAVQACVRLLGDSIASLPLGVYRKSGAVRTAAFSQLIDAPTSALTDFEWKFQMVSSLALRGNSYQLVTARDRREYATALEPLHPDVVQVELNKATGQIMYRVDGQVVPTADMVHIKRFVMPGWLEGLSPIGAAAQSIGLGIAAERYGAAYFRDSASPSAVLSSDQNMDDDQTLRIMKTWVDTHGGRRLPAVLSGGMKYQPIAIAPGEAQFLETREFQRGEIAMLFGVPPHMIGDTAKSTSWGTGIEQQSIGFAQYTLRPWLTCIESALSRLLPPDQFVQFNIDALLRGDQKARYEAYEKARWAGWLSVNEIRELEDRQPITDGDGYLQPLNYGPLGGGPDTSDGESVADDGDDSAADDFAKRANSVGILVRSGFDAESARDEAGLPPTKHTGLLPVTVVQTNEPPIGGDNDEETPDEADADH